MAAVRGTINDMANYEGDRRDGAVTLAVPDLTLSKSHSGNFKQGDAADTYTITVSNVGSGPTTGW